MEYKYIEMSGHPREAQFKYFKDMAYPYVGMTVNVDVTDFVAQAKERELPFFLSFCYCVAQAANAVPELRQRIRGDKVVEYSWCQLSCTLALPNGSYCYCDLDSDMSFQSYLPKAMQAQERAMAQGGLEEGADSESRLFISSVPWLSYSALVQPVPSPADSNPRISWGKYFQQDGRTLLPVSILCHHALADGLHISRFYSMLDMVLSSMFR